MHHTFALLILVIPATLGCANASARSPTPSSAATCYAIRYQPDTLRILFPSTIALEHTPRGEVALWLGGNRPRFSRVGSVRRFPSSDSVWVIFGGGADAILLRLVSGTNTVSGDATWNIDVYTPVPTHATAAGTRTSCSSPGPA